MTKKAARTWRARKLVEVRPYKLGEAAELSEKRITPKFNETCELAIQFGR